MKEKEIMIVKMINSNLGMRSSAKNFFEDLNNISNTKLVINFENVKFMSRSFAQEYVQQKKRTNKIIIEKNKPKDVQCMLNVVKNSKKPKSSILASK